MSSRNRSRVLVIALGTAPVALAVALVLVIAASSPGRPLAPGGRSVSRRRGVRKHRGGPGHHAPRRPGTGLHPDRSVPETGHAEPVPRARGGPRVRGRAVHHRLPAHHCQHDRGPDPARPGRPGRPAPGRRRQPGRHPGGRRESVLHSAPDDALLGLPDRHPPPAHRRVARLPRVRGRFTRQHRPRAGHLPDRPPGPGADPLPHPDGLRHHPPAGPADRRRPLPDHPRSSRPTPGGVARGPGPPSGPGPAPPCR